MFFFHLSKDGVPPAAVMCGRSGEGRRLTVPRQSRPTLLLDYLTTALEYCKGIILTNRTQDLIVISQCDLLRDFS